jgi:hypothetical protein
MSDQTVKCRVDGHTRTVTLDDRVYPDRTCGQHDSGWWAMTEVGTEVFVSVDGSVYGQAAGEDFGSLTRHAGVCPQLARRAQHEQEQEDAMMAGWEGSDPGWRDDASGD